jgi:hypothetical protein
MVCSIPPFFGLLLLLVCFWVHVSSYYRLKNTSGKEGQLGNRDVGYNTSAEPVLMTQKTPETPALSKNFRQCIKQIACGQYHTVALSGAVTFMLLFVSLFVVVDDSPASSHFGASLFLLIYFVGLIYYCYCFLVC